MLCHTVDGKIAVFSSYCKAGALNTKLLGFCFLDFSNLYVLYKRFSLHQEIPTQSAQKTHQLTPGIKLSSTTVASCKAILSLDLILQNFMQVFNVGLVFFSAHQLSDPNTDSETKSEKVNQSPHAQAKPPPLGVVLSHAGMDVRAMDRKHPQKMGMLTQKEGCSK